MLPRTRSSREKLLQVFEEWLIENWRMTLSDLVDVRQVDVELASEALVAYGKSLFTLESLMAVSPRPSMLFLQEGLRFGVDWLRHGTWLSRG